MINYHQNRDNEQFIHDAIGFPEQIALKFFVEKHHAEVRYKRWTWASYVLYALGWGLGLVGSLSQGERMSYPRAEV